MIVRYYLDDSGGPHIYNHGVDEDEVEYVLRRPIEDRRSRQDSRMAIGQTSGGRYLKVIYVKDTVPNSVFVITAYELTDNALAALKRRTRRKRQW